MVEFLSLENFAGLLTCFATLMIFSFLYRDNPFYKFAEHVFVGTATGYQAVLVWFQIVRPNLVEKLLVPEDRVRQLLLADGRLDPANYMDHIVSFGERLLYSEWIYLLFLVLGVMMLFKVTDRLNWVSRWPLAYVIGAFAGIQVIQATQGSLLPQVHATMKDFTGQATVVELLEDSGLMPDGEFDLRTRRIDEHLRSMCIREPESQDVGVLDRERERFVEEMRSAADPQTLARQPRVALADMRLAGFALAQQDQLFEAKLCSAWGGRPLERTLLALQHSDLDDVDLVTLEQELRDSGMLWTSLATGVSQESLAELDLPTWQSRFYGDVLRVRLESAEYLNELTAEWEDLAGAQTDELVLAFCRPAARPSLLQLYKSEGFPTDLQPDWSNLETNRIVDSLMTQVNTRPAHLAEWNAGQLADLRMRLDGDTPDLAADFRLRMASLSGELAGFEPLQVQELRDRASEAWLRTLLEEGRLFRQTVLADMVTEYCKHDLLLPFSREQKEALRENPEQMLAHSENAISSGSMRWRMLIEILSNLLVVVGVCTGVFYFFFSKKHTGALGVASKVGIAFLMMSFGASFGYTVMGRISLAIGRFQDLLAYPRTAVFALLVLIITLVIWEKLRSKGDTSQPRVR